MRKSFKGLVFFGGISLIPLATGTHAVEKTSTITTTYGVTAVGDIRNNKITINQYSLEQLRQMMKDVVRGGTSDKADKLSLELAVDKQALLLATLKVS